MTTILEAILPIIWFCAGCFIGGLFLTIGAVAGLKIGTRQFGPIRIGGTTTTTTTIQGPIPVVIRRSEE